jgi:hypothetical protein
MEYEIGHYYEFLVGTIQETTGGRKYIPLSDGGVNVFRVKPFEYQEEWGILPKKLKCFVTGYTPQGYPWLVQCKEDVLKDRYREFDKEYVFTISDIQTDTNTDKTFYLLSDAYGIKHRYYPSAHEDKKEVGEELSLTVTGIRSNASKNSAYLLFMGHDITTPVPSESTITMPINEEKQEEESILKESEFGKEGDTIEFKSTIVYPAGQKEADIDKQIYIILKVIASFSNHNGGVLYIGVDDRGQVCGINDDMPYLNSSKDDAYTYQSNVDGYELKIRNSVRERLGSDVNANMDVKFFSDKDASDIIYCAVEVKKASYPVFLDGTKLFQRAGNMIQQLKDSDLVNFIRNRSDIIPNHTEASVLPIAGKELKSSVREQPLKPISVNPYASIKGTSVDRVWRYLTLYDNGEWSYNKKKSEDPGVMTELRIKEYQQNDVIVLCYDNGCVNVMSIKNLLRPAKSNGSRILRKAGKHYQKGWNQEAKLMNAFIANREDAIACLSIQHGTTQWFKAHVIKDISEHADLTPKGNILVNPALDAVPISFTKIDAVNKNRISSLILRKGEKSTNPGFTRDNINFEGTIKVFEQLINGE